MIGALLSGAFICGLYAACGLAGKACERALSRRAEHEDRPKITVW